MYLGLKLLSLPLEGVAELEESLVGDSGRGLEAGRDRSSNNDNRCYGDISLCKNGANAQNLTKISLSSDGNGPTPILSSFA